ncbi:2-polyprenyl-3-methyl-6-methoxy-1,4-benzoquinone monooxygenase [Pseudoteredinibacter isoporae]|uniref:3-demethoxyubiquinol 3-hydroxylase n=1 Tax=Pseudoteredinibacter isoporae TaxID=570281 RepID=A0A7X0JTD5_9GAMM|nr:2-polyprenyl-3-methyl-6-methoxy-1,4-benzoquinone monooxygenase [Pseudoteredinibacter isoporae]MBB6520986.1 ubiquinone biosynthesis monooxygenase Coq7 [Pseudoteredinibacter isoporae]NHO86551.1 2-polyprenyl-3-methyl-6-methoxy-1,4-benzoquinone monooxygenase [Pseudoteredinibacter isoporae]NIB24997.1 2-polyprenyl-3-methyl-6-methoxy-1,4-benzoquinone monooxygenase [Pseudoteredinibacter isoporae]
MASLRRHSLLDQLIGQADRALRTLSPDTQAHSRPSPALQLDEVEMSETERQHAAGLMRVNHTGEVMAQALYQGQAMTAKLPEVREEMEHAADEEIDHLAWCEDRTRQLGSHTSVLNPMWYSLSFGMGAAAGLISDRVSLGFVSAIEDQVCEHLEEHLQTLPEQDQKSRAIVEQMLEDEEKHSHAALEAGGIRFPGPIKQAMSLMSKAMTKTSYRI